MDANAETCRAAAAAAEPDQTSTTALINISITATVWTANEKLMVTDGNRSLVSHLILIQNIYKA